MQWIEGNPLPLGSGRTQPAHELVLTAKGCMSGQEPITSGCLPVHTRTGWQAERPCVCNSSRVYAVLNCEGAAPS